MSKTTLELKDIAKAGGGISIDADSKTTLEIKDIAKHITSGAILIVRNADAKTTLELKDIAKAAPGKVIFKF